MTYGSDEKGCFGRLFVNYPIPYRVNNVRGVFNHEIGTHYLRKYNDMK